jgi:hypothetical protein
MIRSFSNKPVYQFGIRIMSRPILIGALILPLVLYGCLGGLRSAKPNNDRAAKSAKPIAPAAADNAASRAKDQASEKSSEPQYSPPRLSETDKLLQSGLDLRDRAEVNQAALDFVHANNIRNLKHLKTCHDSSGWYMLIYTEKGKKASMAHYNWDSKNKEWTMVLYDKQVTPQELEWDFKGEAAGEKCFQLQ